MPNYPGDNVLVDMLDACGTDSPMVITVQNNTVITSPKFPQNYPNNLKCTWHIVAEPNENIELSFKEYETENEYDTFIRPF